MCAVLASGSFSVHRRQQRHQPLWLPVRWRGRGSSRCPGCHWRNPDSGWLLACELAQLGDVLALLALGVRFVALCAEQDPDARVAAQLCMPEIVSVSLAEHIRMGDFLPLARKRQVQGFISGGGSPGKCLSWFLGEC